MQSQENSQPPCSGSHRVNGDVPTVNNLTEQWVVCDCGRIDFRIEECGCPAAKHMDVKSRPHE